MLENGKRINVTVKEPTYGKVERVLEINMLEHIEMGSLMVKEPIHI